MHTISDTERYYASNPDSRDPVYQRWERQEDLQQIQSLVHQQLSRRHVLEIACGTGFWTETLAAAARSLFATDASVEMLARAKQKLATAANVVLSRADAYDLQDVSQRFTGAFAGLWWSHVPRETLP